MLDAKNIVEIKIVNFKNKNKYIIFLLQLLKNIIYYIYNI